jgi:hypothetical protein
MPPSFHASEKTASGRWQGDIPIQRFASVITAGLNASSWSNLFRIPVLFNIFTIELSALVVYYIGVESSSFQIQKEEHNQDGAKRL